MDKLKSETLQFIWKRDFNIVPREIVRYSKVAEYFNRQGRLLDVGCRGGSLKNS